MPLIVWEFIVIREFVWLHVLSQSQSELNLQFISFVTPIYFDSKWKDVNCVIIWVEHWN